jgi:hypothetical protein
MGVVTPWWQLSITNPEGNTAPLEWIVQPGQSSQMFAEFHSTSLLHPSVGDRINISASPTGNLALAADLVTLAYETLGIIDPIQSVDKDPGFLAELIQTEAIGLAQQVTSAEIQDGFSGNSLGLDFLLNSAIPWVLSDATTLPSILAGAGSIYLTQYLGIPFASFNKTLQSALLQIASDLASTAVSGFGYGTLAYQTGMFVGVLGSNATLAPFSITNVDYQNSTSCQELCDEGGGGVVTYTSLDWESILWIIVIVAVIVATLAIIVYYVKAKER